EEGGCGVVDEHVGRAELRHLFEDAVARDVAAHERDVRAGGAELLGRLLRGGVVPEVADRDPVGAVRGEAARDRAPDPARAAGDEDVQGRGRSAGAELCNTAYPGRMAGLRPTDHIARAAEA